MKRNNLSIPSVSKVVLALFFALWIAWAISSSLTTDNNGCENLFPSFMQSFSMFGNFIVHILCTNL